MTRTQTDPGEHSRNRLDAQLVDLLESVMSCERAARREDRLDATIAAAVRYGRR